MVNKTGNLCLINLEQPKLHCQFHEVRLGEFSIYIVLRFYS